MGRGRALGTAAMPRVREDEGDPNLQCELSSDRQNGGVSIYASNSHPRKHPVKKWKRKIFSLASTRLKGVNDNEVNEPMTRKTGFT